MFLSLTILVFTSFSHDTGRHQYNDKQTGQNLHNESFHLNLRSLLRLHQRGIKETSLQLPVTAKWGKRTMLKITLCSEIFQECCPLTRLFNHTVGLCLENASVNFNRGTSLLRNSKYFLKCLRLIRSELINVCEIPLNVK